MKPVLLASALLLSQFAFAQKNKTEKETPPVFEFQGGSTFARPKTIANLESVALPQTTVIFKQASTREFVETERSLLNTRKRDGGTVSGRLTAYLEFTDGDMQPKEYQAIADHFYQYYTQKLTEAGIKVVDWNSITAQNFYQSYSDVEETEKGLEANLKKGQIAVAANANGGNVLRSFNPFRNLNIGFAGGKMIRLSKMCNDLDAPALFTHVILDFADIILDGEVSTSSSRFDYGGFAHITSTKEFKFNATCAANVKVMAENEWDGRYMGGENLFFNKRSISEIVIQRQNISSGVRFASSVKQDASRAVLKVNRLVAINGGEGAFNSVPVVIETTKALYTAAAKKALENFADEMIRYILSK